MKYIITAAMIFGCSFFSNAQTGTPTAADINKDKAKAAKGDADAMYRMGMYTFSGTGMPKDMAKATSWLTKAAGKGSVPAMTQLGMMYEEGEGVPKDGAKAASWLQKAAAKGDAEAMAELGDIYEEGIGVPKDMTQAFKYYHDAAEKDWPDALITVAMCYLEGNGVAKNTDEGVQWLQKAADRNDVMAMRLLGDYYTDSTMGNSCKAGVDWYMKAAEKGDTISIIPVGEICLEGNCTGLDRGKIARWMESFADRGLGVADYFMGRFYVEGKGVVQDYDKAMDYFMKDAEMQVAKGKTNSNSVKNLFVMYEIGKLPATRKQKLMSWLEGTARKTNDADMMAGIGFLYTNKEAATDKDYKSAMEWSVKSADQGNATGCYNVAYLYANGLGVKEDDRKAFDYMTKAAQKGDRSAMLALSDFYENGQGVVANHTKALEWKKKAKEAEEREEKEAEEQ